jgi:hypothetical protein
MAKRARVLTAKERTVNLPGVNVCEQDNRVATFVDVIPGALTRLRFIGGHTHLVRDRRGLPICGAGGSIDRDRTPGKVCIACRVEASRLRLGIR